MRTLIYIVAFLFLLLFGGQKTYAFNSHNVKINYSSKKFNNKKNEILSKQNQSTCLLEGTDIDFEEEFSSSDNFKVAGNKIIVEKHNLLNALFLKHSPHFISNYLYNRIKNYPIPLGFSSPIYITQGVLRI